MTKRQIEHWRKKMKQDEEELIGFHVKHSRPDGSFMLHAFLQGYRAAVRELKRKSKARTK
jgi:hypothetical protein